MTNDTMTPPATAPETSTLPQNNKPEQSLSLTEKKVVSKLRDQVDERGNFKFKLKDYALGYAAGKGLTEIEGKEQVKEMFKQEMGTDLQTYLESDRLARGKDVDRSH